MTKKHFIALADAIRCANERRFPPEGPPVFDSRALENLAAFCASQNPRFNRARWLAYIAGECGPNGGKAGKAEGGAR